MTFRELEIAEPILKAICEKGYEKPTPIQEKGIPVALGGGDMLGIAQTGTGKTAAFGIPLLQKIDPKKKKLPGRKLFRMPPAMLPKYRSKR